MTEETVLMPGPGKVAVRNDPSLSGLLIAIPLFFLLISVVIPLWLFLLLPLAAVSLLSVYIWRMCIPRAAAASASASGSPASTATPLLTASDPREFEVVLYGATGFTGQLAAAWLAKHHPRLKWAIAGRNRDALNKVRSKIGLPDLPIIVADSADLCAIDSLVRCTKVVCSTAGPFAKYGSALVQACAANGTNWCDITGEIDWVREMIDEHDETARRSGAMLVSLCGHDSVPWDLCVFALHKCLQEKCQDVLTKVALFDDISAQASGGTMATVFNALEAPNKQKTKSTLGFDPLLKGFDGRRDDSKYTVRNPMVITWSGVHKTWTGPFFMAAVNANCVRRSNALLKYSPLLSFSECQTFPNFFDCFNQNLLLLVFATMLACLPLRMLLLALGVVPSPGQGPSAEQMAAGHLYVTGYGTGQSGRNVKCVMTFNRDAGYLDTARMLCECAILLAAQDSRNPRGGCHTPASAFGQALLDKICASGTQFHVGVL